MGNAQPFEVVRLRDSSRPDATQDGRQQLSKRAWEITRAERVDRTTVALGLAGDFDWAAYEPAGELLQALERRGARLVVIDLEHVGFIGIVGTRFLVEAQERADLGGWALVIVAPRDPRQSLLALADLDDQLNITHRLRRSPRSA
jgi:anti-anti-sigma factor